MQEGLGWDASVAAADSDLLQMPVASVHIREKQLYACAEHQACHTVLVQVSVQFGVQFILW